MISPLRRASADAERVRVEGGIRGLGPELRVALALVEELHRRERAHVRERDARAVLELERRAREPRLLVAHLADLPVAVHPKVNRDRAAVVEMQQLVLAAALDAHDATALESAQPFAP